MSASNKTLYSISIVFKECVRSNVDDDDKKRNEKNKKKRLQYHSIGLFSTL